MKGTKLFLSAGGKAPFINTSKAAYARIMEALVKTQSRLSGSAVTGEGRSGTLLLSVVVPIENVKTFKEIAKCSLSYHMDLSVGMNIARSTKWVDENGNMHRTPHPDVKL